MSCGAEATRDVSHSADVEKVERASEDPCTYASERMSISPVSMDHVEVVGTCLGGCEGLII